MHIHISLPLFEGKLILFKIIFFFTSLNVLGQTQPKFFVKAWLLFRNSKKIKKYQATCDDAACILNWPTKACNITMKITAELCTILLLSQYHGLVTHM